MYLERMSKHVTNKHVNIRNRLIVFGDLKGKVVWMLEACFVCEWGVEGVNNNKEGC